MSRPVIPKHAGECAFCKMEFADVYTCPKCKRFYCTLRCYKSQGHMECSNAFYQNQIAKHIGAELDDGTDSDDQSLPDEDDVEEPSTSKDSEGRDEKEKVNGKDEKIKDGKKGPNAHLTFAEYMQKHRVEDQHKTEEQINPDIGLHDDEELIIDEDDDPEYIQDVITGSMADFEGLDDDDIDKQLRSMGIDPDDPSELMKKLNSDEAKKFRKIADEMFGIQQKSCFK